MSSLLSGWSIKPLGEVATLQRGFDLPIHLRTTGDVPVFAANGIVGTHNVQKVKGPGVVTGRSGTLGEVHFVESDYWPLNTALWVKDFHGNDPRWVAKLLKWMRLETHTRGTGVPTLNRNLVHVIPILVPPLQEQQRIAAILDKADAVRRKRSHAIQLTEELLRATFLDMFGDPVTNSKGWEVKSLGNLVTDIESGWSPNCDSREAEFDEWGILKLGSVTWGHFNPSENKALLPDTVPRPELEVKPGDLLFSRKNTYELVGASAFVHSSRPKLLIPDLIFRLRLLDTVNPVYIWQALSQKTMRVELSKLASGSSGSMPNISKARLRTLRLPVPPLELQSKYHRIATVFWRKQNHLKESSELFQNLFNSLLHRAFTGEL